MSQEQSGRRRRILLKAAGLSAGTLLFTCGGTAIDDTPGDSKGSSSEDGGYDAKGGTAGYAASGSTGGITGNPKAPYYDTGGYGPMGGTGGATVTDAAPDTFGSGGFGGNPKGSWYDSGGYEASDAPSDGGDE